MSEYLQYWKDGPRPNERLDHTASSQFRHIKPNDVIWVITFRKKMLFLAGPIVVGQLVDQEEAEKRLSYPPWEAKYHVMAKKGTISYPNYIDLSKVAALLRFVGQKDRLPKNFSGSSFQRVRKLRSESAELIRKNWAKLIPTGISVQETEEERIETTIRQDSSISVTEKEALIKARIGQGKFRKAVLTRHQKCPFTGVCNPIFLRAAHIKPWSQCRNNAERLDPLNGIPLTPVADQLFDQGLVSFNDKGWALFSPLNVPEEMKAMGISIQNKYRIEIYNPRQKRYLRYHRTKIFQRKAE